MRLGRLDVVVNNAGFGDIAPFEQLSAERFKAVIDTNFYGVVNVTRAAVPHLRKQRSGCIFQISSVGRLTRPGSTPTMLAKWAVGVFTESLAQELSPFGVNPAECGRTGVPARTRTRPNSSPIMNRPSALLPMP
jgi:NAD(P)-dependent dehydrogenase (short-subunit alcohol dehydrogenase family)